MLYIFAVLIFITGLIIGGLLFKDTKPRRPLSIQVTHKGWDVHELTGLLASVIIQKFPGLIPNVVMETEHTLVFEHPRPKHKIHYLFMPKKDIKNIGDLSDQDHAFLLDMFSVMNRIINDLGISNYRIMSNGPEKQDVGYLHFHLWSD